MKTDAEDRLEGLFSALFPPDTPVDTLPVDGFKPSTEIWRPRLAAVLVPIVLEPEPAVVLTVRSHALKSHAGQVAFPGGGRDPGEAFPLSTALREAEEEVGIAPGQVEVRGFTCCFDTITAYRIVPVVGILRGDTRFQACPREVLKVFRLPLSEALDPAAYRSHRVSHRARSYQVWSMRSACWPVWGATAAILVHLAQLAAGCRGALPPRTAGHAP